MTQYLTLKGSRSMLSRSDIQEGIGEGRYRIEHYKGVSLYSPINGELDQGPVWAIMEGCADVYCMEPMEWPENGAYIQGIVIVNPAI